MIKEKSNEKALMIRAEHIRCVPYAVRCKLIVLSKRSVGYNYEKGARNYQCKWRRYDLEILWQSNFGTGSKRAIISVSPHHSISHLLQRLIAPEPVLQSLKNNLGWIWTKFPTWVYKSSTISKMNLPLTPISARMSATMSCRLLNRMQIYVVQQPAALNVFCICQSVPRGSVFLIEGGR